MPIHADSKHRYPSEWPLISLWMRVCAGWRCEWCDARQNEPHPVTGSRVVLTVAHVYDHSPENVTPGNLAALCQRCHLRHDAKHHTENRRKRSRARMGVADMLEAAP